MSTEDKKVDVNDEVETTDNATKEENAKKAEKIKTNRKATKARGRVEKMLLGITAMTALAPSEAKAQGNYSSDDITRNAVPMDVNTIARLQEQGGTAAIMGAARQQRQQQQQRTYTGFQQVQMQQMQVQQSVAQDYVVTPQGDMVPAVMPNPRGGEDLVYDPLCSTGLRKDRDYFTLAAYVKPSEMYNRPTERIVYFSTLIGGQYVIPEDNCCSYQHATSDGNNRYYMNMKRRIARSNGVYSPVRGGYRIAYMGGRYTAVDAAAAATHDACRTVRRGARAVRDVARTVEEVRGSVGMLIGAIQGGRHHPH